jgi:hypothetical protein
LFLYLNVHFFQLQSMLYLYVTINVHEEILSKCTIQDITHVLVKKWFLLNALTYD